MRLVACPTCETQYDATGLASAFRCACGAWVAIELPEPVHAPVQRCAACGGAIEEGAISCEYCGNRIEYDHRHRSLICPACFAQNPDDAKFCTACGVAFRPQAHPHEVATLACPDCQVPLNRHTVDGALMEECPACRGLWVTPDDFDRLVARMRESMELPASRGIGERTDSSSTEEWAAVTYRRCPACNGHMQRKNFGDRSGVIVDWCGKHGTWLDANELQDIAAFVHGGGLTASAPATEPTQGVWAVPEKKTTTKRLARGSHRTSWIDVVRQLFEL